MIITASHSFAQAHFEVIDGLRYLIDENAKEAALLPKTDEKYAGDVGCARIRDDFGWQEMLCNNICRFLFHGLWRFEKRLYPFFRNFIG